MKLFDSLLMRRIWRLFVLGAFAVLLCLGRAQAKISIELEQPRYSPSFHEVLDSFKRDFGQRFQGINLSEVRVYGRRNAESMREKAVELGLASPPEWAFGVCYPNQKVILIRLDAPIANIERTLVHELVHLSFGMAFSRVLAPLWFREGIAQMFENGASGTRGEIGLPSQNGDRTFGLEQIANGFPHRGVAAEDAYRQSLDMTWFLHDQLGEARFTNFVQSLVNEKQPFTTRFEETLGYDLEVFESKFFKQKYRQSIWQVFFRDSTLFALVSIVLVFGASRRRRDVLNRLETIRRKEEQGLD